MNSCGYNIAMRSLFTVRTDRTQHSKFTVEFKPGRGYVRVYVGNHDAHWMNVPLRMFNTIGTAHGAAIEVAKVLDKTSPKWYAAMSVTELEAVPWA